MKSKLVYVATVALMATGMVFAQSGGQGGQGDSATGVDSQTGNSTTTAPQTGAVPTAQDGKTQANPKAEVPGAMGTPTEGSSPNGETPGTGEPKGKAGTTDNGSYPGANPATAPTTSDATEKTAATKSGHTGGDTPSYAKPITKNDSTGSDSTSTPLQNGTDSGAASPK